MSALFEFRLQGDTAASVLSLRGELTIAALDEAYRSLGQALQGRELVEIDLAGLTRADSGAIALLLDIAGRARAAGLPVPRIIGLPAHLRELLDLYHLQHVFSLV
ncbi:STAS domain-containing protein [Thermithiobacillus plumbiphilus]|uniref:STAS domain-containing protein n=1 Tax=Thermithiobacillus plumbiphilus TaxID=1729899 RepID=A0ABU9D897_9PROT